MHHLEHLDHKVRILSGLDNLNNACVAAFFVGAAMPYFSEMKTDWWMQVLLAITSLILYAVGAIIQNEINKGDKE